MSTLSQFFNVGGGTPASSSPIKSIQRGVATLDASGTDALTITETIANIDKNKAILSFSSRYTSTVSTATEAALGLESENHRITGIISSNTSIIFQRASIIPSTASIMKSVTIEWQVTEFN